MAGGRRRAMEFEVGWSSYTGRASEAIRHSCGERGADWQDAAIGSTRLLESHTAMGAYSSPSLHWPGATFRPCLGRWVVRQDHLAARPASLAARFRRAQEHWVADPRTRLHGP